MSEHHNSEHGHHNHENHETHVNHETAPVETLTTQKSPSALLNGSLKSPHFRDMEMTFRFKTRKPSKEEEAAGAVATKRANLVLHLPVLTFDGLIEKLSAEGENSDKLKNFILDAINAPIIEAAREQVTDDEKPVTSQAMLDIKALALEAIANRPKSERAGSAISETMWKDWAEDYVNVMVEATGKKKENVENASRLFLQKFRDVKSNKQVLTLLQQQLSIWATKTENMDEFQDVYQYLDGRVSTLINKEDPDLLASL